LVAGAHKISPKQKNTLGSAGGVVLIGHTALKKLLGDFNPSEK
jgi:hypothetical protein